MLSFDLSVMDIVLAIAVVVLLLLLLAQRKDLSEINSRLLEERPLEKPAEKTQDSVRQVQERRPRKQPSTGLQKCIHHFGYLGGLPRDAPVPDECLGCSKILNCRFPNR
jgi:hypothetical protein